MTRERWSAVDAYFNAALIPSDPALDAVLARSEAAGLPAQQVAANQGTLLMLLARMVGATRILEVGTLGGYSTIWLARALPPHGYLVSLERDPVHAEVARKNIAEANIAARVEVRVGAALGSLRALEAANEAPFDVVFIDADKENNPVYFRSALALSRPGSIIVVDNVVREGAVTDATSADPRIHGVRQLVALLESESRVQATALQTVGDKGYDGFILASVLRSSDSPR